MALDNAEFIAELSPSDPPGTDPLNQGDDHIRTTKRAVQQSFPNVGSAVPQTGVQMAQMAIKNEVNTFTQQQTFSARIVTNSGNVGDPAHKFINDLTTGMYLIGVGQLGFTTAGVERLRITASQTRSAPPFLGPNGSVGAPSYSFTNNTNMGMYRDGSNVLAFATAGVQRGFFDSLGLKVFQQMQVQLPTAAGSALVVWRNTAGEVRFDVTLEGTAGFNPGFLSFNRWSGASVFEATIMQFDDFNNIIMPNLPTSTAFLIPGTLWNNGGVVNVV